MLFENLIYMYVYPCLHNFLSFPVVGKFTHYEMYYNLMLLCSFMCDFFQ